MKWSKLKGNGRSFREGWVIAGHTHGRHHYNSQVSPFAWLSKGSTTLLRLFPWHQDRYYFMLVDFSHEITSHLDYESSINQYMENTRENIIFFMRSGKILKECEHEDAVCTVASDNWTFSLPHRLSIETKVKQIDFLCFILWALIQHNQETEGKTVKSHSLCFGFGLEGNPASLAQCYAALPFVRKVVNKVFCFWEIRHNESFGNNYIILKY